jgi:hypothetical protein
MGTTKMADEIVKYYEITLTDKYGAVRYTKVRDEVGNFINGIDWDHVLNFSVEPLILADWEIELLHAGNIEPDTAEVEEVVEEEWRIIDTLPTKAFEINREGVIRIKVNQKVLNPIFDIDFLEFKVQMVINGMEYWVHGPRLAKEMWKVTV